MVQEFHVLRCFTCESFQVQQVKKANRWSCKLCGEKQSMLKEFGRGSAADCRRHVQKLNAARGAKMEEDTWLLWKQLEAHGEDRQVTHTQAQVSQPQGSRWSKYLDTPEEEGEENVLIDRQQLHGNNIMNRKRKIRDGRDSRTPGQSNGSSPPSPRHTSPPSPRHTSPRHTSPPSPRHTSPPSLRHTSPRHTSPPTLNSAGPVSRWTRFLSSDCQAEEEEQTTKGRSHTKGGASDMSCNDRQAPPLDRPRPPLPVPLFESGEDFSWEL